MLNSNHNGPQNTNVLESIELAMILSIAEGILRENVVNKINEQIDKCLDNRDFEKIPALLEEKKQYV